MDRAQALAVWTLFFATACLVCSLIRYESQAAVETDFALPLHVRTPDGYFQRGHFLADAKTVANIFRYLLQPDALSKTNTIASG